MKKNLILIATWFLASLCLAQEESGKCREQSICRTTIHDVTIEFVVKNICENGQEETKTFIRFQNNSPEPISLFRVRYPIDVNPFLLEFDVHLTKHGSGENAEMTPLGKKLARIRNGSSYATKILPSCSYDYEVNLNDFFVLSPEEKYDLSISKYFYTMKDGLESLNFYQFQLPVIHIPFPLPEDVSAGDPEPRPEPVESRPGDEPQGCEEIGVEVYLEQSEYHESESPILEVTIANHSGETVYLDPQDEGEVTVKQDGADAGVALTQWEKFRRMGSSGSWWPVALAPGENQVHHIALRKQFDLSCDGVYQVEYRGWCRKDPEWIVRDIDRICRYQASTRFAVRNRTSAWHCRQERRQAPPDGTEVFAFAPWTDQKGLTISAEVQLAPPMEDQIARAQLAVYVGNRSDGPIRLPLAHAADGMGIALEIPEKLLAVPERIRKDPKLPPEYAREILIPARAVPPTRLGRVWRSDAPREPETLTVPAGEDWIIWIDLSRLFDFSAGAQCKIQLTGRVFNAKNEPVPYSLGETTFPLQPPKNHMGDLFR